MSHVETVTVHLGGVRAIRCPICSRRPPPEKPCVGCGGSGEIVSEWIRTGPHSYLVLPVGAQVEIALAEVVP